MAGSNPTPTPFATTYLDGPLIDPSGRWNEIADLGFGGGFHYQKGYRRAAEAVVASTTDDRPQDLDELIYPVVFLYRHLLELDLKELVAYGSDTIETHDLAGLWRSARSILEREVNIPAERIDAVASRIMELHDLDARATAFRYAYKREELGGGRSVSGRVNLKVFAQRAQSLCDTLEAWDIAIYEHRQSQAEMEDEAREYNQP